MKQLKKNEKDGGDSHTKDKKKHKKHKHGAKHSGDKHGAKHGDKHVDKHKDEHKHKHKNKKKKDGRGKNAEEGVSAGDSGPKSKQLKLDDNSLQVMNDSYFKT